MENIKFNKHHVIDLETKIKARVLYSAFKRISDGKICVKLYAKDYDRSLGKIFKNNGYINESDMQSDYSDAGSVVFFEDHPLYAEAKKRTI